MANCGITFITLRRACFFSVVVAMGKGAIQVLIMGLFLGAIPFSAFVAANQHHMLYFELLGLLKYSFVIFLQTVTLKTYTVIVIYGSCTL